MDGIISSKELNQALATLEMNGLDLSAVSGRTKTNVSYWRTGRGQIPQYLVIILIMMMGGTHKECLKAARKKEAAPLRELFIKHLVEAKMRRDAAEWEIVSAVNDILSDEDETGGEPAREAPVPAEVK